MIGPTVDSRDGKGKGMHRKGLARRAPVVMACLLALAAIGNTQAQEPEGKGYGSCKGVRLSNFLSPGRSETINDVQQSWVGDDLSELVASWGAPTSTFENRNGTRILTWRSNDWLSDCSQSFEVDTNDKVTRWNHSNCHCLNGKRPEQLPKDTPLPQMTL